MAFPRPACQQAMHNINRLLEIRSLMVLNKSQIEHMFYRFLAAELSINELEQWIYSTAELEEFIGASQYLELISFNFQQQGANHELSKLICRFISKAMFDIPYTVTNCAF
jgi:hypothetical protein